jgi:hypothetical protein
MFPPERAGREQRGDKMNHSATLDEYRVRFPNPVCDSTEIEVRATVDRIGKTITYELPDNTRATIDVVTARALHMILWESVYGSLEPNGPFLRLEKHTGDEWPGDPSLEDLR